MVEEELCKIKNVHDEIIELPKEYPSDLWVHNNLVSQRDKPLEAFDSDELKELYMENYKICYGL